MKTIILVLLGLATTSTFALAGGKGGNGGNGVVCFDKPELAQTLIKETVGKPTLIPQEYVDHITSIEALDLYLARAPRDPGSVAPTQIHQLDMDYVSYARRMIDQLAPYTTLAFELSQTLSNNFAGNMHTFYDAGLFPVDDIAPPNALSGSCVLATVIAQRTSHSHGAQLYIDGRLFNHPKHSKLSQGVFWLHETILANTNELRDKNGLPALTNTDDLSLLVGYLISDYPVSLRSVLNLRNWLLQDYSNPEATKNWKKTNLAHQNTGLTAFLNSTDDTQVWLKDFRLRMENTVYSAWTKTLKAKEVELSNIAKKFPKWYRDYLYTAKWVFYTDLARLPECLQLTAFDPERKCIKFDGSKVGRKRAAAAAELAPIREYFVEAWNQELTQPSEIKSRRIVAENMLHSLKNPQLPELASILPELVKNLSKYVETGMLPWSLSFLGRTSRATLVASWEGPGTYLPRYFPNPSGFTGWSFTQDGLRFDTDRIIFNNHRTLSDRDYELKVNP